MLHVPPPSLSDLRPVAEWPKSTGAKLYSRPSTLVSTGAKVPVAPVESAPMVVHQLYLPACDTLIGQLEFSFDKDSKLIMAKSVYDGKALRVAL